MANRDSIASGVWPVMLTPFREDRAIDWPVLDALIDWYLAAGASGLFAVCLSSEMFHLDADERLRLARHVVARAGAAVPVVATGTFGSSLAELAAHCERTAATGVAATVWLTNALASEDETEAAWLERADELLRATPGIPFGLYECPDPYKRLLGSDSLAWAATSEDCRFLKDTSCRLDVIEARLATARGSSLKLFNANAQTLLPSLALGADGFCGISANFVPELWAWLCQYGASEPDTAARLQAFLSRAEDTIVLQYPKTAKYYLRLCGIPMGLTCRNDDKALTGATKELLMAMKREADAWRIELGIDTARPVDTGK